VKQVLLLFLVVGVFAATSATANATQTRIPAKWKNCTAVNARYPHGVGRNHAHDSTTGVPVTNFKHSTRLYKIAMHYNKGLDRDKDGIACEKP
jgi:Excalibur calcium-binding domain